MRSAIKQAAFRTLQWSGLNALARWSNRHSLFVLNYHGVMEGDLSDQDQNIYCTSVGTEEFRGHLEFLVRHFNPVKATDVEAWIAGERELPPRAVLLTFDDGRRNNLTHAGPLLRKYEVPAIVFLATAYMGSSRLLWPEELHQFGLRWPRAEIPFPDAHGKFMLDGNRTASAHQLVGAAKRLPVEALEPWLNALRSEIQLPPELAASDLYAFLSWDEVRQMPRYGFEIGSHTVNHWIVTNCTAETLRYELQESKIEIERQLGSSCLSFCYPNGAATDWSPATATAVRSAGYRLAYALPDRIQPRTPVNAYAINRLAVPGSAPQEVFRASISGTIGLLRAVNRGL